MKVRLPFKYIQFFRIWHLLARPQEYFGNINYVHLVAALVTAFIYRILATFIEITAFGVEFAGGNLVTDSVFFMIFFVLVYFFITLFFAIVVAKRPNSIIALLPMALATGVWSFLFARTAQLLLRLTFVIDKATEYARELGFVDSLLQLTIALTAALLFRAALRNFVKMSELQENAVVISYTLIYFAVFIFQF